MKYKVGDRVRLWGIGYPDDWTEPGIVSRAYEFEGHEYVDFANEVHCFAAWHVEYVIPADIPVIHGFQRLLPVER